MAHIELGFGNLKFVADGSDEWVDAKYEIFMARIADMQSHMLASGAPVESVRTSDHIDALPPVPPLAIFLREKSVGANQNNRFLATVVWLKRNGHKTVKTTDVVKALADAQQQRLGNPADILNQNVKKGFLVKVDDGFYVTPEGEESLK